MSISALAGLALALPAGISNTRVVPDDFATIQAALDASASGDTVLVRPGTYRESLRFHGRSIALVSTDGAAATILDGGGTANPDDATGGEDVLVWFDAGEGPGAVLQGFTLRGAESARTGVQGAAVLIADSSPTLRDNVVEGNYSFTGAGVACVRSSALIDGCTFRANKGTAGVAMWLSGGSVQVMDCDFDANLPDGAPAGSHAGTAIAADGGAPTIRSSRFTGNRSYFGGAISLVRCSGVISSCEFEGNMADSLGGAINCGAGVTTLIEANEFVGNAAVFGGAVMVGSASPTIRGNRFDGNVASAGGGGIAYGSNTGGIAENNDLIGNTVVIDGALAGRGGGIGAVSGACSAQIRGNRMFGNSAAFGGGFAVALNAGAAPLTVRGNVIARNFANTGGGVHVVNGARGGSFFGNTIHGNSAATASGMYLGDLTASFIPQLSNQIVWGNTGSSAQVIVIAPADYSFRWSDVAGGTGQPWFDAATSIDRDPEFVNASGDDFSLLCSSPCVDRGNPDSQYDDADGTRSDMGAIPADCSDVDPPVVTIVSPPDRMVVGFGRVMVEAAVDDESPTTITSVPAGVAGTLPAGGGAVQGEVLLAEGPNVVSVLAVDAGGRSGGSSVTVTVDTTPPEVRIVAPLSDTVTGADSVALTIDVVDATATIVSVAGRQFELAAGGGRLVVDAMLIDGANRIDVSAADEGGNVGSASVVVHLDRDTPVVRVTSPPDGACFGADEGVIELVAEVADASTTRVVSSPAGIDSLVPAGGGTVSGDFALAEGGNVLSLTATDATGREGATSITVVLDTMPPVIAELSPGDGEIVRGVVDVLANVQDPLPGSGVAAVVVQLDDAVLSELVSAPFELQLDTGAAADGPHALSVEAIDGKGNRSIRQVQLRFDNSAPEVRLLAPFDGAIVGGEIAIDVEVADGGEGLVEAGMLVAGVAPTSDGSRRYEVPLATDVLTGGEATARWPDGPVAIRAFAVDAAGNRAEVSVSVVVDNTAPAKTLLSPLDGATVSGTFTIEAAAEDATLALLEIRVDGATLAMTDTGNRLAVPFDSAMRLDGAMRIEVIAIDAAGNRSSCTAIVTVDNLTVGVTPRTLNLKSRGNEVTVTLEGTGVAVLLPLEAHLVELRVPGGNSVRTLGFAPGHGGPFDSDGDGLLEVRLRFDREALIASIRAGIASGAIHPTQAVGLTIVVDADRMVGGYVLGTDFVNVRGN